VEVPRDHEDLRRRDAELAGRWREAVAEALEVCFAAGLIVGGFDRDRSAYLLAPEAAW
jgi:predicted GNAT superfamily acetyltransferase